MLYCEVRYASNRISVFKAQTVAENFIMIDCTRTFGTANLLIKTGIDVFGVENIILTLKRKEKWHRIDLLSARTQLELWRAQCDSAGLHEIIQLELEEEKHGRENGTARAH